MLSAFSSCKAGSLLSSSSLCAAHSRATDVMLKQSFLHVYGAALRCFSFKTVNSWRMKLLNLSLWRIFLTRQKWAMDQNPILSDCIFDVMCLFSDVLSQSCPAHTLDSFTGDHPSLLSRCPQYFLAI